MRPGGTHDKWEDGDKKKALRPIESVRRAYRFNFRLRDA